MITGVVGADFSAFEAAVQKALGDLRALEQQTSKGMGAMTASTKQFDGAQSQLLGTLKSVGGVLGVAMSAAAVGQYVISVGAFATEVDNLAKKSGLSTDALQVLGSAAEGVGSNMQTVAQAAGTLVRQLGANDTGLRGAVVGLGIDYNQLKASSPDEMLMATMSALARVEDETTQLALANELYGKAAGDMITIIRDTGGNLDEMKAKAEAAGLVIGKDSIDAIARADKAWSELGTKLKTVTGEFIALGLKGVEALQALGRLDDVLAGKLLGALGMVPPAAKDTGTAIEGTISTVDVFQRKLQDLKSQALEPLNEEQKRTAREAVAMGLQLDVVAQGVGSNVNAIRRLIESDKDATKAAKERADEQKRAAKESADAAKALAVEQEKVAEQVGELITAGTGWQSVVDRMNPTLATTVRYLIEQGVSLKTLTAQYPVSTIEVNALTKAVEFEKKARADLLTETEAGVVRWTNAIQAEIAAKSENAAATTRELTAWEKYQVAHDALIESAAQGNPIREQEIKITRDLMAAVNATPPALDAATTATGRATTAASMFSAATNAATEAVNRENEALSKQYGIRVTGQTVQPHISSSSTMGPQGALSFNNPTGANIGAGAYGGGFNTDPTIRALLQQGYTLNEAMAIAGGYGAGILGGGGIQGQRERTARADQLRASAGGGNNVNVNMTGVLLSNDPSSRAQLMDVINSTVMDTLRGQGVRVGTA